MAEAASEHPTVPPLAAPKRRYALTVLLVIYILNFLDRQVVNILAEPIKLELGLADWQVGVLTGLAFALFYTFLGLPIARLAERGNRVKIISVAVAIWSLFTMACGLATNFVQLLLARIGVGVGEAGCTPPAHSLISDYAPKEKRASALAFYSLGIPLGSLAGMALGGLIADAYGWRAAFLVAGAPGVLMALLAWFTLPEPRADRPKETADTGPTLGDAARELRGKSAFWWIAFGAAINAMVSYGHIAFYGSFYMRNHTDGLAAISQNLENLTGVALGPIGFIGLVLGVLIGIFGAIGTYLGGFISDHVGRKDARAYTLVPAIASVLSVPPFLWAMLTPSVSLSLILLTIPVLLNAVWYGPIFATAQGLVRPQTRATASALLLFVINLIGLGLGPLSVGLLSDSFSASGMDVAEGLRWAIIVVAVFGATSLIGFVMASRKLREQLVS
jgi:MFS family permease